MSIARLADLMTEPWLMAEKHFLPLFTRLQADAHPTREPKAEGPFPRLNPMKVEGGVATIAIDGVLLKSVPEWMRAYEINATGYDEIQGDLAAAVANKDVQSIRLLVNSPGGQLSGITDAAASIETAGKVKPVSAEVVDGAYSAAYWLACQAKSIVASPTAGVGSIGTFLTLVDLSGMAERWGIKVHLVTSGRHKGVGAAGVRIEQDQLQPFQRFVDQATDMFVAAVAKGRRVSDEKARGWATGDFWMAAEARSMGLIDAIRGDGAGKGAARAERGETNHTEAPGGVPLAASNTEASTVGENPMTEQEKLAAAEAKARGEARTEERQLLSQLKAAFPNDLPFALEQFEKGATLEQAKAAYADVLIKRNETLAKENQELKEAGTKAATQRPAPVGSGNPAASDGTSFMDLAKADQRLHVSACAARIGDVRSECCTLKAAMSRTAAKQPQAHEAFLNAQVARVEEFNRARVKAGATGATRRIVALG